MALTKPVQKYKPAKHVSHDHFVLEDWLTIQRLAAEKSVPSHWIVVAAAKFATRDSTKLEFTNRLDSLLDEVRSEMGVQKGVGLHILTCHKCGLKAASEGLLYTHMRKKHPLEVLVRN